MGPRFTHHKRLVAHSRMTRRELEIAALIAEGLTNREIADQLSIKEQSVKNHLNNIYAKLSCARLGKGMTRTRLAITVLKDRRCRIRERRCRILEGLLVLLLVLPAMLEAQKTYRVTQSPPAGDMRLCSDAALTSCSPVGSNMSGTLCWPTATRAGLYTVEETLDHSPAVAPLLWAIHVNPGPPAQLRPAMTGTDPLQIPAGGTGSMPLESVVTDQYGNAI